MPAKKQNAFDKIEKLIVDNNPRAIHLTPLRRDRRGMTLQEFLLKFFTEWNAVKETIYADTRETQTPVAKNRSLGDIFMLCRYYYPECTLNQVLDLLYVTLPQIAPSGFRSTWCTMINKRTWYFDPKRGETKHNHLQQKDEYGNNVQFYLDNIVKE